MQYIAEVQYTPVVQFTTVLQYKQCSTLQIPCVEIQYSRTFPLRFSVQILFVKWLTGLSLGRLHSNGFYRPYHSHHTSRKKHSNKNFCLFKIFTDHRFSKFRFRFSRYQGIRIKGMEMVIYQAWESQSHGFADGFIIFSACARNLSYLNPTVKAGAEQCRLLLNYY